MRTRRMVVATFAAVALLGTGCAEEATRDESGDIVEEGELDVFSFAVGDCFSSAALGTADEPAEVGGVDAVPCKEPHENEVFHLYDVDDEEFPGVEALQTDASEGCEAEFEGYVGEAYLDSPLDIGALWPTDATWKDGDREIVCYLFDGDGKDLEGSMEGSGSGSSDDTTPDDTTDTTEDATEDTVDEDVDPTEQDVFSFEVGDCFSSAELGTDEPTEVGGVDSIPCSQPHENEVYHLFDVTDEEFPGTEALQVEAREGCLAEFEDYVDATYDESVLEVGTLWPTEGTWENGDREIVCYLFHIEGEDLEGSMEGYGG